MNDSPSAPASTPSTPDLEALRGLYARARGYLDSCRCDPLGTGREEDPRALLAAVRRALAGTPDEPVVAEPAPEPPRGVVHQIRPRQSA